MVMGRLFEIAAGERAAVAAWYRIPLAGEA
jgi:hypothetical protein